MTFPITPLPGIHNDSINIQALEQQAIAELSTLTKIFETFANQIILMVVNAVLRAFGLGSFAGSIDGVIGELESLLEAIPSGNIQAILGSLNLGADVQGIVDEIVNALGVGGVNHTLSSLFSILQNGLSGLLPPVLFNGDGTYTTLTGFISNLDGTLTYDVTSNSLYSLINNLDGTLTTAAQTLTNATQAAAASATSSLTQQVFTVQNTLDTIVNTLLSSNTFGNPQEILTSALQNYPNTLVVGTLGSTDIGGTIQSTVDAAVQSMLNDFSSVGNSLGIFSTTFSALTNFLGFRTGGISPPANSVAGVAAAGNVAITDRGVQNNIFEAVDPTANAVFALSDIESNSTLPNFTVSEANAVIGYITTRDGGIKESIDWIGFGNTSLTAAYLTLYGVNTTTGLHTWVYTSPNIVGTLAGTIPAWKSHNLPNANFVNTTQGNIYAVELRVVGTGTHTIIGKQSFVPAHPIVLPAAKGASRAVSAIPQKISVGVGSAVQAATTTYTHTIVSGSNAIVLAMYVGNTSGTLVSGNVSITVGGVAMSLLLGPYTFTTGNNLLIYQLLGTPASPLPTGAQTVSVTITGSLGTVFISVDSVEYSNVSSFGTLATNSGSGTTTSVSMPNDPAQLAFMVMGNISTGSFSAPNFTSRYNQVGSATTNMTIIGDHQGGSGSTYTATCPTGAWGVLGVPIISAIPAPTTIANPGSGGSPAAYQTATPWFSMSGSPSSSLYSYTPVLLTFYRSDTFNPANYPWANYFDVIVCSAGGGGAGGNPTYGGGLGGGGGSWNAQTLTAAQAGTSPWTITVGSGGAGGAAASTPGAAGGASSVLIPGFTTVLAAGGSGGPNTGTTGVVEGGTGGTPAGVPHGASGSGAAMVWTDANGDPNTYYSGAGGVSQQTGGTPGGGGGGGWGGFVPGQGAGIVLGGAGGGGAVYVLAYVSAAPIPFTPPSLAETLTDNFAVANAALWSYNGGASVASGQLHLVPTLTFDNSITSVNFYDISQSHVIAQLVQPPNVGNGTTLTFLDVTADDAERNALQIIWNNNQLTFRQRANNVNDDTVITYNATQHQWLRISAWSGIYSGNLSDQVFWATSPDGLVWTTQKQASRTISLSSVRINLESGYIGTEPSPGTALWANVGLYPTRPKMATLTDAFNTLNTTAWWAIGPAGQQPTVSGGQLHEVVNTIGSDLVTKSLYDLTGSQASVQLVQIPPQGPTEQNLMGIYIRADDAFTHHVLTLELNDSTLYFREWVNGTDDNTSLTYSPTAHKYIRIRESGGTVYWETSPDDSTWTIQRSKVPAFTPDTVITQLSTMIWGSSGTSGATTIFDNFNL